ncbi:MAG: DUF4143 domain-containing protein [Halobacteriota archaeon]
MTSKKREVMTNSGGSEAFIDDAKHHNQWWSEGTSRDLQSATETPARSDLHRLLKAINREDNEGTGSLVYPIYGQTGIGKTTMLYQFISSILTSTDYDPGGRDFEILGAVNPRQVLYVPLEESLYQLERSEESLDRLHGVINYFQSHVASHGERRFIILDDIGALGLDEEEKQALLNIIEEETDLLVSGIVESQVTFAEVSVNDEIIIRRPIPVLPMKFIDRLKHSSGGEAALDVNSDLRDRLESYQSKGRGDDQAPIREIRYALGTGKGDVGTAVSILEDLYFEHLSKGNRDQLHEASKEYLRTGGIVHQANGSAVKNELVKSHFLLYLYKELADYESIQSPENLHRVASLAASQTGAELRYTDISEQLEVDRRTVDTYLDALDDGLAVSESHDYSLRRYRRTRLYLRNPRHVVLLSRRAEHYGFESYDEENVFNPEFEYKLAQTVAFDHAMRLAYATQADDVEYCETEPGTVDYILQRKEDVLPFVLSYHPYASAAEDIAVEFDPSVGQHTKEDSEELYEYDYEAPYRFVVTDSLPRDIEKTGSLTQEQNGVHLCYIPYWLFLLIC